MDESRNPTPSKEKDRWDKWSIGTDIVHKIVILIIGAVVAGIFYIFQQGQVESRYFAEMMAQRESTESELRAQMFKPYFTLNSPTNSKPETYPLKKLLQNSTSP